MFRLSLQDPVLHITVAALLLTLVGDHDSIALLGQAALATAWQSSREAHGCQPSRGRWLVWTNPCHILKHRKSHLLCTEIRRSSFLV
jgi:hypothetical protein